MSTETEQQNKERVFQFENALPSNRNEDSSQQMTTGLPNNVNTFNFLRAITLEKYTTNNDQYTDISSHLDIDAVPQLSWEFLCVLWVGQVDSSDEALWFQCSFHHHHFPEVLVSQSSKTR